MCLHPRPVEPVPEGTARVARAAFPKGNTYLEMRQELGRIFEDEAFVALFPTRGKPALSPWRLALVTVMQFAEGLSDRQAADAVRARIDWKYALSLELEDPGFDASVLCEFRARLAENGADHLHLDLLLERFRERRLLKTRGKQRTDSTHVLAAVRDLNRLELAGEAVRLALNALAVAAPTWLLARTDPDWASRYARTLDEGRLPKGKEKRLAEAERIGADGFALLEAVCAEEAPRCLRELPALESLRRVWVQNFLRGPDCGAHWRRVDEDGLPAASVRIDSPTDPESRRARKTRPSGQAAVRWLDYKVHLTETCDDGLPRIVTHVETHPGPTPDRKAIPPAHEALKTKDLLPETHLVDMGYTDAGLLLDSRDGYGVDLLGPMRGNYGWHAREGTGFGLENFTIDWKKREATCPEGKKSVHWRDRKRRGEPIFGIAFSPKDCGVCPSRDLCVGLKGPPGKGKPYRELTVASQERYEALKTAREREETEGYAEEYRTRDGIEATVSLAVRRCGLRRTRYRGLGRVRLGHALTAAGLNFARVGAWFSGIRPAPARESPFASLTGDAKAT